VSLLAPLAAHTHPTWTDFGPTAWVAIAVAGAIAGWCVWKAVMLTLQPGEREPDHIKRQILQEPSALEVSVSSLASHRPAGAEGSPASEAPQKVRE